MIRFSYHKNTALFISILLMTACQPPEDTSQSAIAQSEPISEDADLSFIVNDDTVTLSADSILNLKSSRYQPSLGLQGEIEPIKQSKFVTAKAVTVQQVLVQQGQWVEEGTPLFILALQDIDDNNIAGSAGSLPRNNEAKKQADDSVNADKKLSDNINDSIIANTTENITDSSGDKATSRGNTDGQPAQKPAVKEPKTKLVDTAQSPNVESNLGLSNETASEQGAKQANPQSAPTPAIKREKQPESQPSTQTTAQNAAIIVRASFAGRVTTLPVASGDKLAAGTLLLSLADDTHLQFIATLPIQAEPQLSVGQNVNFSTQSHPRKYTGQISKLSVGDNPNKLKVHVQVLKNDASREGSLKAGMIATGRVNYGQIAVGTIVPELAIHDADLSALKRPPYQPITPLTANVWIVKQDQRLTRQPVEIIEYNPDTEQYLIAGVNNDSLICLADLPVESAGKKVVIS
jgi:multidrug efflux pump subunit AcrA (membrane-fusion protein)